MKRILLVLYMMAISTVTTYAGNNPPGGHRGGHAPEMTDVAMALAGLTSVGGYFVIRRRFNRQK